MDLLINLQENFFRKQLVLIGGGHANIQVLKKLCMNFYEGLHIILINNSLNGLYSGMTPSYIQNEYEYDQITIDLQRLCFNAGATFINDEVIKLDTKLKKIKLNNRPSIYYDLLSINTGSISKISKIKIHKNAKYILVKPINELVKRLELIDKITQKNPTANICMIGGGIAAFEISFALFERYGSKISIKIISQNALSEKNINSKSAKTLLNISKKMGIKIIDNNVKEIMRSHIKLTNNETIQSDLNLISSGAELPNWLLNSSLEKIDGYIGVDNKLLSINDENIFASGDVASVLGSVRSKSGVMAVRHGEILKENIFLKLQNKNLKKIKLQKNWLYIIGTYKKKALLNYYNLSFHNYWCWLIKKRIDKNFIKKFLFNQKNSMKKKIIYSEKYNQKLNEMYCQGCGSKVSKNTLLDYLIIDKTNSELSDSSIATFKEKRILQTIDHIKLFNSLDPYDFGIISYLHSQNDIIATGGRVNSLNVSIAVPFSEKNTEIFFSKAFMKGIKDTAKIDDSIIISGHSYQSYEPGITICMNGIIEHKSKKSLAKENDLIYLSKPLGTGYLLAAYFKNSNLINADGFKKIIHYLKMNNLKAVEAAKKHNSTTMTDISGFGLASHLSDICIASNLSASINLKNDILIDANQKTLKNFKSTGYENNLKSSSKNVKCDINHPLLNILYDPQTNGPMLMVINSKLKNSFEEMYFNLNHSKPILIGNFKAKEKKLINIIN